MIIVKIGGSLYNSPYLTEWLDQLTHLDNQQIVIVPGGGPFADQVRHATKQWDIDDTSSHNMAVLAMQQYGYLLSSINNKIVLLYSYTEIKKQKLMVWMPYRDVTSECDYPENWQTTSDSLAAWLACQLSAQNLAIVKSADVKAKKYQQIIHSDMVDEHFSSATGKFTGEIKFYHSSQAKQFISDNL